MDSRIGSRCCLRIVIPSNSDIAFAHRNLSRCAANRRTRAGWPFSRASAKSVRFSASDRCSAFDGGPQAFQHAAFLLDPLPWQFNNLINAHGPLANWLKQRGDLLQAVPGCEDSPIEALAAGVEPFGQGGLVAVSQQGKAADFAEIALK